MNKKILFAAVGAALAVAPMISAQAEVKVGGMAHISLDSLDRGTSTDTGEWFLSNNSSNFNISASEDLGGGMKAIAKMEFKVLMDSPASVTSDRDQYLGLKGGFGTILMGQYNDPVKTVGRKVDLFYNEQLGESRAITRGLSGAKWDERMANSIGFKSNDMGGLSFEAQYGVEDSFTTDATQLALAVHYKAGPLYIGVAHKTVDNTAATTDSSVIRVAGTYTMGAIKFAGFYQQVSDENYVAGADRTVIGLGVAFKSGNNTFKAQWYSADELDNAANTGADQTSIGIDHSLSKNTVIYATYAKTSNDTSATYGVGSNGHGASATPAAGVDASGFSLGMRMKF
jgi:predicted porin